MAGRGCIEVLGLAGRPGPAGAATRLGLLSGQRSPSSPSSLAVNLRVAQPTVEDVPLIDELRYLLGDPPDVTDDDEDESRSTVSMTTPSRS